MAQFTSKGMRIGCASNALVLNPTIDGSTLVSVLWPRGLPQFVKGNYSLAELHDLRQLVPTHEDGLREWCYVATDHSSHASGRNKFLAYTSDNSEAPQEIAIHFQGFVRDVHLDAYGTWSG